MGTIYAMHWRQMRAERQWLPLLVLVGLTCTLAQSSSFITGELDVYISNDNSQHFFVRNSTKSTRVSVPEETVEMLTQYAGYQVQMKVRDSPPPPPAPFDPPKRTSPPPPPSKRANRPSGRGLQQSQATTGAAGTDLVYVDYFEIIEPANGGTVKSAPFSVQQNISAIIYMLRFCGWNSVIPTRDFRTIWNGMFTAQSAAAYNVQNYLSNCTLGQVQFTPRQTIVEVPLPCFGSFRGSEFNFQTGFCDQNVLESLADDYVQRVLNLNTSSYKYKFIIVPYEFSRCDYFDGSIAYLGCTRTERQCVNFFTSTQAVNRPSSFIKAIGHNMGMMVSGANVYRGPRGNYEWTCVMGSGTCCYNVAQSWRMGWATPVPGGDLNSVLLDAGTWKTFQLPFATWNRKNHIRIVTDWDPTSAFDNRRIDYKTKYPGYFISLRAQELFDNVTSEEVPMPGRVLIHTSYGRPVEEYYEAYVITERVAVLNTGEIYRNGLPSGLVVQVEGISSTRGATVRVCRATVALETGPELCNDGIDNDCDGFADNTIPDCTSLRRPPAPRVPRVPRIRQAPRVL